MENDVEATEHFLLHCRQFVNEKRTFLSTLEILTAVCQRILVTFWHELCFLEIRHLVQVIAPRFLVLQLILSDQLKDLMNSFFMYIFIFFCLC